MRIASSRSFSARLELAQARVGGAAALVGLRQAGIEDYRLGVIEDRAGVLAHAFMQHAVVIVIACVARRRCSICS